MCRALKIGRRTCYIGSMRHVLMVPLALVLLATPAIAQDTPDPPDGDVSEGLNLLEEGAKLLFRGLRDDIEPTMRDSMEQMLEMLRDLNWNGLGIDDLDAYHPPEVLPNGDIIIRRRTPLEQGPEIEI